MGILKFETHQEAEALILAIRSREREIENHNKHDAQDREDLNTLQKLAHDIDKAMVHYDLDPAEGWSTD